MNEFYVRRRIPCPGCHPNGTAPAAESPARSGVGAVLAMFRSAPAPECPAPEPVHGPGDAECPLCEGRGTVENDVPFKTAMLETLREMYGVGN